MTRTQISNSVKTLVAAIKREYLLKTAQSPKALADTLNDPRALNLARQIIVDEAKSNPDFREQLNSFTGTAPEIYNQVSTQSKDGVIDQVTNYLNEITFGKGRYISWPLLAMAAVSMLKRVGSDEKIPWWQAELPAGAAATVLALLSDPEGKAKTITDNFVEGLVKTVTTEPAKAPAVPQQPKSRASDLPESTWLDYIKKNLPYVALPVAGAGLTWYGLTGPQHRRLIESASEILSKPESVKKVSDRIAEEILERVVMNHPQLAKVSVATKDKILQKLKPALAKQLVPAVYSSLESLSSKLPSFGAHEFASHLNPYVLNREIASVPGMGNKNMVQSRKKIINSIESALRERGYASTRRHVESAAAKKRYLPPRTGTEKAATSLGLLLLLAMAAPALYKLYTASQE